MPSLKDRVAHQRETLIARGPGIRLHAERVHTRLCHPAVLVPAFLAGMLIARGAPVLRSLPKLTARVGHFTEELGKLDAIVKRIAALAPFLLRPSGARADDTNDAQSSPGREATGHRSPST